MVLFFLNFLTLFVISILGIFSIRRLLFALTVVFTKVDWKRDNSNTYHPFITILIPCHNEESVIAKTLSTLVKIEYPKEKLEIVVIDDLSTDATLKIINDYAKKYSYIHSLQRSEEKVRGKAAALNEALAKFTAGEIVYFLDADHRLRADTLLRLVRHLSDQGIGAVNGRSIPRNRAKSIVSSYVYLESLVYNRITMYASDRLGLAPAILGSNFCIRRSILEIIGKFNEEHLTEDLDLTVAIYRFGYRVKYDLTSITEHEAPENIRSYILQHLRWNRGFNAVAKKHWFTILLNKKMPVLHRIDEMIVSLGYLDRIFFCLAFALTIFSYFPGTSYEFPYWVWIIFIGLPASQIFIGLFKDGESLSMYIRLPLILLMFFIDIYVTLKARFEDFLRKPTCWYKTARADDKVNNS